MTNKEAIMILESIQPSCGEKYQFSESEIYEAIDMAIEALEGANDDTISRQAAIDAVKRNTFRLTLAEEQNCEGHVVWSAEAVYSDVMENELLELPSAQPLRAIKDCRNCRHGNYNDHWENYFCYCPDNCNDWDKWEPSAKPERVWTPCDIPPNHHKDVIVRGVEAIGNVAVYKIMQWDVDRWRPENYAPSIIWLDWSEI